MVSSVTYYCCAATQLPPEDRLWMGHRPFNLAIKSAFERDDLFHHACVLTLGVCGGVDKGIAAASNCPSNTSHYYAVLSEFEQGVEAEDAIINVSSGTYEAPEHDCGKDHVSDGSTITYKRQKRVLLSIPPDIIQKKLVRYSWEVHLRGPLSKSSIPR